MALALIAALFSTLGATPAPEPQPAAPLPVEERDRNAASEGDIIAYMLLADGAVHSDNMVQAESWWLRAAEAGHAQAQYKLGELYASDQLGVRDEVKAMDWYRRAADQTHPAALRQVCDIYANAGQFRSDAVLASKYCRMAAEAGISTGLTYVGLSFAEGSDGRKVDGAKAVDYLTRAAKENDGRGMTALGVLYLNGRFVKKDYSRSAELFRQALVYKHHEAAAYLGQQYEKGLGVSVDLTEAGRLYFHSAPSGNILARKWLVQHPEVNANRISERRISWFSAPKKTWTVPMKKPDGTSEDVDFREYWFEALSDLYPEAAVDEEIEGDVDVECRWNSQGDPENCIVQASSYEGYGFEQASVTALTTPIPITQKKAWIRASAGRIVRIRIKWTL